MPPKPDATTPKPTGPPAFDFNRSPFIVIWETTRACDLKNPSRRPARRFGAIPAVSHFRATIAPLP